MWNPNDELLKDWSIITLTENVMQAMSVPRIKYYPFLVSIITQNGNWIAMFWPEQIFPVLCP